MRLIDKDKLMEKLTIKDKCDDCQYHKHNWFCDRPFEFEDICEAVRDAHVVEIIHCKDCKYFDTRPIEPGLNYFWCHEWGGETDESAFCSCAEREKDATD